MTATKIPWSGVVLRSLPVSEKELLGAKHPQCSRVSLMRQKRALTPLYGSKL